MRWEAREERQWKRGGWMMMTLSTLHYHTRQAQQAYFIFHGPILLAMRGLLRKKFRRVRL